MRVDFYHLTRTPLDRALPRIAERLVADGGRLLVVDADADRLSVLDRALWTWRADSFLPHAVAGADDDAAQPVLLSADAQAANGARNIAIVDGEWRDAALAFDRAFHFFTDDAVEGARRAWRGLKDREGVERHYWKQGDSGWERAG